MPKIAATQTATKQHRIFIVDDHAIIRQALLLLLDKEPLLKVCGEAEDESQALQQIELCRPDLVVVDIFLKNSSNGLSLISAIKQRHPEIKALVWSYLEQKLSVESAMRAGANGYLSKEEPFEQVVDAIHKVLQNTVYLSPLMAGRLMERFRDGKPLCADPFRTLSNREMEVFAMIGQGLTTQQIASILEISPKTIETHRERIKQKLDLKNAAQLNYRATHWALQKE